VARRWGRPGLIGVFVGTTWGRVVFHPRARGSPAGIAIPFIVGIAADWDWRPLTVVLPRTVATWGRDPAVVLLHGGRVGTTRWGTRPVWVTNGAFLKVLNIGDTRDDGALELSLVQFLHGGFQVVGGFKFHKPSALFAASLRVNDVQTRLAGKVF